MSENNENKQYRLNANINLATREKRSVNVMLNNTSITLVAKTIDVIGYLLHWLYNKLM